MKRNREFKLIAILLLIVFFFSIQFGMPTTKSAEIDEGISRKPNEVVLANPQKTNSQITATSNSLDLSNRELKANEGSNQDVTKDRTGIIEQSVSSAVYEAVYKNENISQLSYASIYNAYEGGLHGTTPYSDDSPNASVFGNSLVLNGASYIAINSGQSLNIGNNLTIEAWIKPTNLNGRFGIFSTRFANSPGSFQLEVGTCNGKTNAVGVTGPNTWVAETQSNVLTLNVWNHIVYTRSGTGNGTHKIYVNGVLQTLATDNSAYVFVDNADSKRIGEGSLSTQRFEGKIDEVRIWNRARTESEIQSDRNVELTGLESGLVGYWNFNLQSGVSVPDCTQNHNDALLNIGVESMVASGTVVPLPPNTTYGQLNANLYGNTMVNLLGSDGDFEIDTNRDGVSDGWSSGGNNLSLSSDNKLFNTYSQKIKTVLEYKSIYKLNVPCVPGHKYLLTGYYYIANKNSSLSTRVNDTGSGWEINLGCTYWNGAVNTWNQTGTFFTASDKPVSLIPCFIDTQTCEVYLDGWSLIDLTATYGTGNEPTTLEQIGNKVSYVNGIKSVSSTGLKSVGKNLIENGNGENGIKGWEMASLVRDSGYFRGNSSVFTGLVKIVDIPVKRNTNYMVSYTGYTDGKADAVFSFRDSLRNVIKEFGIYKFETNAIRKSEVLYSGNNDSITLYMWAGNGVGNYWFREFQMEEFSTPSEYESNKTNSYYMPQDIELRSLPNKISDELNLSKGELIKNTNKISLDSQTQWSSIGEGESSYVFSTFIPDCIQNYAADNAYLQVGYPIPLTREWIDRNQRFHFYIENGVLAIIVPKSIISGYAGLTPVDRFREYIASTKSYVIYQLAQPQIYKINTSPLICYPNGTLIVEPVMKSTAAYTSTGITVTNKELPIRFIKSLYKLNGSLMVPIDLSKVRIVGNGLSFTVDGAKAGEVYEYTYQYDQSLTTLPTIKYSVSTDPTAQIQGNTEMIQLLLKKIETLEEKLGAIESDRAVQYEYDSNGRLVKGIKQ